MKTTASPPADRRLEQDAQALYEALSDLIRVYQFRDRDRICCYDVSVTQCHALEVLIQRAGASLNDLAADLYLDKSTASRVVSALERKGYLRRGANPADRRAVRLEVTAAGSNLYQRIRREIIDQERRLLADFDPTTRQSLTELLRRLARAAADRVDVSGGTCCIKPDA